VIAIVQPRIYTHWDQKTGSAGTDSGSPGAGAGEQELQKKKHRSVDCVMSPPPPPPNHPAWRPPPNSTLGPAPHNYGHGLSRTLVPTAYAVSILLFVTGTLSILLRMYSRAYVVKLFGLDDWLMTSILVGAPCSGEGGDGS
jgi:hypothetical protein